MSDTTPENLILVLLREIRAEQTRHTARHISIERTLMRQRTDLTSDALTALEQRAVDKH